MDKNTFTSLFPVGSHLCREPMPSMSEMKKDMGILKKNGFNLVKLQENWAIDEALEGGYDFSKYEELTDYADKLDMGVYLGITCEQAPNWLWEKHPDCRMVGRNGHPIAYQAQTTMPGDGKPGPCYDHPGAMSDQLAFIKKLVEVLGKYQNLVVWNTWQEIAYWSENYVGQHVCYCSHTLDYFRRWLEERYGDLDNLNRCWNSRYKEWSLVFPDRLNGNVCTSNNIDWKYFMDNVQIANILQKRAQAIKEVDPLKRPVFAHRAYPVIGSGSEWVYARTQDFLGCSAYPAGGIGYEWDDVMQKTAVNREEALLAEMWSNIALRFDYIRSSSKRNAPVWAAEFQGGPVNTGLHCGRIPSAQDIRRWMLTAVGTGVTAISFWVTRAEIMADELNGFGLLDSEGDTTERIEEAGRIGKALNRHANLFAKPNYSEAEVAVLINEWNYQLCMSLANGGGENLPYSIRGWHRILWDAGIPMDFIEASRMDADDIRKYKAIILPFPLSISEELTGKLKEYVWQGGSLVSEACPGRLNEYGYANRGGLSHGLRELFGVNQKELKIVREPGNGDRWVPKERTWGEYLEPAMLEGMAPFAGMKLRANYYIETYTCTASSVPILKYSDDVAGAVRKYGNGKAFLIGTFIGHNGTAYPDLETRAFTASLLKECDVVPLHQGRLLLRKRKNTDAEAWCFTNPTGEKLTELIDVRGWKHVEDLLGEELDVRNGFVSLEVAGLDVRILILKK